MTKITVQVRTSDADFKPAACAIIDALSAVGFRVDQANQIAFASSANAPASMDLTFQKSPE